MSARASIAVRVSAVLCLAAGSAGAEPVEADATDINWGIASEFGRGLGLGIERRLTLNGDSLVAGVGAVGTIGQSSVEGTIYNVAPGVAVGYRKYLGGFYLGPSVGFNVTAAAKTSALSGERDPGDLHLSAMLDVGYRWRLGASEAWNLRLGLSGGYGTTWAETRRSTDEVFAITSSVGR
jgi:hypothetical protein